MTPRIAALAVALAAIGMVLAQDLLPVTPLYHTWQYALALTIALIVMLAYANGARRGRDGLAGKRLLLALAGAVLVDVAGLAAGLLGPDTASVRGTPGTVVPVPAVGAAAFFEPADASAIARGTSGITLRRRTAPEIVLSGSAHRLSGESLFYLEPHPAAYVDVSDERGAHLTVTQPTNASFLSPVLLFAARQRIGELDVPLDTFAVPARHRVVHALYFTPRDLAQFPDARLRGVDTSRPALILTAADDAGNPLGITFAPSGADVALAGLHVRSTIGSYPALAIAAAPATWALIAGIVLFCAGIGWSMLRPRGPAHAPAQPQGA